MNWINNVVRPKIQSLLNKRETPENLWIKCPETGEMVFHRDLEANQWVIPGSEHHMRITSRKRLENFFDGGKFKTHATPFVAVDPLKFRDERRYVDRLKDAKAKTGMEDAVLVASGDVHGDPFTVAVQDFNFMGGSLGMAAGEAIITGLDLARKNRTPFVLFAASGGARMQEGSLSLMQMPRTVIAREIVRESGLPFVVVLTDPAPGGVTASLAMLGDIHIAEPGAIIGFAGQRVIQETIREQLPDGFQRSEYLLEHGMVDMVVHRKDMRDTLIRVFSMVRNPLPKAVVVSLPKADKPESEEDDSES